ncbi:MAG: hypothetical protein ACRC2V_12760 [Xenococcaceae cyanobacterium]
MAPIKTMLLKSIRSPLLQKALEIVTICEDGDRIILVVPDGRFDVVKWLTCQGRKTELKEVCACPLSIRFGSALIHLTGNSSPEPSH